jgi:hypothetical protein
MIRANRTTTPPTSVSQRAADPDEDPGGEQRERASPHVAYLQRSRSDDKRQAIRMALDIITAVSKGLHVPSSKRRNGHETWRVV